MDMGQGIYTGIATLVAEELDADWAQMRVEGAAGNPKLYGNVAVGRGRAGHRRLDRHPELVGPLPRRRGPPPARCWSQAAAETWGVPAGEIRVENGIVAHASGGRRASASWRPTAAPARRRQRSRCSSSPASGG